MGEGLSRDLISKGWAVACVDVQEQAGKALVAELGSNAHFIKCDIADYDDQARMYTEVWKKWGRLDALLANAGIVDRSSIYILDHRGSDRYGGMSYLVEGFEVIDKLSRRFSIPPKPNTACTDVDYKAIVYVSYLVPSKNLSVIAVGGSVSVKVCFLPCICREHTEAFFPDEGALRLPLPELPQLSLIRANNYHQGVQLAIHFMRKNSTPGGKIVATASIAAVHPHPSYPEYCGAKAAVRSGRSS